MRSSRAETDYYAILGVTPTATLVQIRAAYRRLALRYHPDVNPPDQDDVAANEFMCQLNEAYDTLSDQSRRVAYDRQRQAQVWEWPEPEHWQADPSRPPQEERGWAAQAPSQPRSFDDRTVPYWLDELILAEERFRDHLRPLGVWVGMFAPVVVAAAAIVLGFWLYMQLRADPQAWALVTLANQFVGDAVGFAVAGMLLVLLVAAIIVWRLPRR